MIVSYCEKWFQPGRRAIKPLAVADAQARHEARQPYCALIGGAGAPTHVVSLAGAWVSVNFLDELRRDYLRYDFRERQPGRLFLATAIFRVFDGSTDDIVEAEHYAFKEDGSALIEQRDLRTNQVRERRWNGDMAGNWERYPDFEDYAMLCREERELPLEPRAGTRT